MSSQIINECRESKRVHVFKNMFNGYPSWENFLDHLSYAFKDSNFTGGNYAAKEVINAVNFWQKLTMTVENPTIEHYAHLNDYINMFRSIHSTEYQGCFSIISFTDSEPTTSQHSDPVDVFYFQGVGKVIWKIKNGESIDDYVLNPGDVIFVPATIIHEIVSLSPRAALSFKFKENL